MPTPLAYVQLTILAWIYEATVQDRQLLHEGTALGFFDSRAGRSHTPWFIPAPVQCSCNIRHNARGEASCSAPSVLAVHLSPTSLRPAARALAWKSTAVLHDFHFLGFHTELHHSVVQHDSPPWPNPLYSARTAKHSTASSRSAFVTSPHAKYVFSASQILELLRLFSDALVGLSPCAPNAHTSALSSVGCAERRRQAAFRYRTPVELTLASAGPCATARLALVRGAHDGVVPCGESGAVRWRGDVDWCVGVVAAGVLALSGVYCVLVSAEADESLRPLLYGRLSVDAQPTCTHSSNTPSIRMRIPRTRHPSRQSFLFAFMRNVRAYTPAGCAAASLRRVAASLVRLWLNPHPLRPRVPPIP
ncbi:hypothetical protein C8Q77DRAFT_152903 [Trametes polyzona]|nr:hypothetical protein C8Q77DRAFT_152903 [Trametes polyzona]